MKTITIIMVLLITSFCYPEFGGGTGTSSDPYLISTAEQLNSVRNFTSAYFKQINDIDLSGYSSGLGWDPIGRYYGYQDPRNYDFSGTYDGNNFKITGLTINDPTLSYAGLFGKTWFASFSNVILENVSIICLSQAGALAGSCGRSSGGYIVINNCTSSGAITGGSTLGGLIGSGGQIDISNCSSSVIVTGSGDQCGGLAGSFSGIMINCSASGDVSSGGSYCGGLIGSGGGSITNCFASGDVSGYTMYIGGFIGDTSGDISHCYSTGNVTAGRYYVGGFVGLASTSSTAMSISNCYSTGNVYGTVQGIGGFAGDVWSSGTVLENCYALGNVSGTAQQIGGFVGRLSSATITKCYSIGTVAGQNVYLGGFLGRLANGTVSNCYWDKQNSSIVSSAAGEGKTTTEMKSIDTYSSWDFENIWLLPSISSGTISYPYLRNNSPDIIPGISVLFAGGTGEQNSPWQISTADELFNTTNYIGNNHNDKFFILLNDLDLAPYLLPGENGYNNGAFWQPIGDLQTNFMENLTGMVIKWLTSRSIEELQIISDFLELSVQMEK